MPLFFRMTQYAKCMPNLKFRDLVRKLNALYFMLEYTKSTDRKNEIQKKIDETEQKMEDCLC